MKSYKKEEVIRRCVIAVNQSNYTMFKTNIKNVGKTELFGIMATLHTVEEINNTGLYKKFRKYRRRYNREVEKLIQSGIKEAKKEQHDNKNIDIISDEKCVWWIPYHMYQQDRNIM